MFKKIIPILLMLVVATVSVSFAAVTVTIDDPAGVATGGQITIPVNITGFDEYLAGEFNFDFGKAALESLTVEAGAGSLYPNGFVDSSAVTDNDALKALMAAWDTSKTEDAFVFYENLGTKVMIYVYAPDKTTAAAGVLFNIKATVGDAGQPDYLNFSGKLLNGNLSTRSKAVDVTDYAKLNLTGSTTVIAEPTDASTLDATTAAEVKTPISLSTGGGTTPAGFDLVLKFEDVADNTAPVIQTIIPPSTTVRLGSATGAVYTGIIAPPVVTKIADLTTAQKEKFDTTWQADEDLVYFTMGNPSAKLVLDKDTVITMDVVRSSDAPAFLVYYLPDNEAPVLAGKDGTGTIGGAEVEISQGGTITNTQADTPVDGKTTYTVAILVDHLSAYVAAATLPSGAAAVQDDDDFCFIATAAYGSILEPSVQTLREFRDVYLLTNSIGKKFVETYYRYSPSAAGFIADHEVLKSVSKVALVPVVGLSHLMLASGLSWPAVMLLASMFTVLAFSGVYYIRRRRKAIP